MLLLVERDDKGASGIPLLLGLLKDTCVIVWVCGCTLQADWPLAFSRDNRGLQSVIAYQCGEYEERHIGYLDKGIQLITRTYRKRTVTRIVSPAGC